MPQFARIYRIVINFAETELDPDGVKDAQAIAAKIAEHTGLAVLLEVINSQEAILPAKEAEQQLQQGN